MQKQVKQSDRFTVIVAYRYSEDEDAIRSIRNLSINEVRRQVEKAIELMTSGLVESVSVSVDSSFF